MHKVLEHLQKVRSFRDAYLGAVVVNTSTGETESLPSPTGRTDYTAQTRIFTAIPNGGVVTRPFQVKLDDTSIVVQVVDGLSVGVAIQTGISFSKSLLRTVNRAIAAAKQGDALNVAGERQGRGTGKGTTA